MKFGGVECGGSSFKVCVSDGETTIVERAVFHTTTPSETLKQVCDWLKERKPFVAVGIASFGPVDLDPSSPTYGYITTTPKPNWHNVDVLGPIKVITKFW